MREGITELQSFMHPFPDSKDVFSDNLELHQKHFLPLMTLDASVINPAWPEQLHIVSVKETYDGGVGEHCPAFHNDFCSENVVSFRVDDNGRYSFLTDFRFFIVECDPHPDTTCSIDAEEFVEHYRQAETSFAETRAFFQQTGHLNPNPKAQADRKDIWLQMEDDKRYGREILPISLVGRELHFIAEATGWSYCKHGPDSIFLYYDPADRIVVTTFGYS